MSEDRVIAVGKDWLEILHLYEKTDVRQPLEISDLKVALLRMAYVRFKREYTAYWDEKIALGEATRRMEDEISELLQTQHN